MQLRYNFISFHRSCVCPLPLVMLQWLKMNWYKTSICPLISWCRCWRSTGKTYVPFTLSRAWDHHNDCTNCSMTWRIKISWIWCFCVFHSIRRKPKVFILSGRLKCCKLIGRKVDTENRIMEILVPVLILVCWCNCPELIRLNNYGLLWICW